MGLQALQPFQIQMPNKFQDVGRFKVNNMWAGLILAANHRGS